MPSRAARRARSSHDSNAPARWTRGASSRRDCAWRSSAPTAPRRSSRSARADVCSTCDSESRDDCVRCATRGKCGGNRRSAAWGRRRWSVRWRTTVWSGKEKRRRSSVCRSASKWNGCSRCPIAPSLCRRAAHAQRAAMSARCARAAATAPRAAPSGRARAGSRTCCAACDARAWVGSRIATYLTRLRSSTCSPSTASGTSSGSSSGSRGCTRSRRCWSSSGRRSALLELLLFS